MKTRIVLKSFDALSFAVCLSKSRSERERGHGGSDNGGSISTVEVHSSAQSATKELSQSHGGGSVALPAGAVWAGFMKNRPRPTTRRTICEVAAPDQSPMLEL